MPDISPVGDGSLGPVTRSGPPGRPDAERGGAEVSANGRGAHDRVELSADARNRLREDEVRLDRVEAVRQAIEEGTYETPDRLNHAIERLLNDLA